MFELLVQSLEWAITSLTSEPARVTALGLLHKFFFFLNFYYNYSSSIFMDESSTETTCQIAEKEDLTIKVDGKVGNQQHCTDPESVFSLYFRKLSFLVC